MGAKLSAIDNLHPDAKFDKLRFIYETNIDILEII